MSQVDGPGAGGDMDPNDPKNMQELTQHVQDLLQKMQDRFQTMSDSILGRIDEMGNRIDDLEKNISDIISAAGAPGGPYDGHPGNNPSQSNN